MELKKQRQRKACKVAAGIKAIEKVTEYGIRQSGVVKTLRNSLKINQVKGFDCQSCAWPNPDDRRSVAEYCENGFKAASY